MEVAHRRHQPDRAALRAGAVEHRAGLGDGGHGDGHGDASIWRHSRAASADRISYAARSSSARAPRGGVPPWRRRRGRAGPVSAAFGPSAATFVDGHAHEVEVRVGRHPVGGDRGDLCEKRDQVVRRDDRGGVVASAVGIRDDERPDHRARRPPRGPAGSPSAARANQAPRSRRSAPTSPRRASRRAGARRRGGDAARARRARASRRRARRSSSARARSKPRPRRWRGRAPR